MKILREINILLLFVTIVIISGCVSNTANPEITPNVQTNTPISTKIENDSIQETIKQVTENGTQNAIKQAVANGTLSAKDIEGPPEYNSKILEKNDSHAKIEVTTKLKFKNPKGAGIEDNKWPKIQISDNGTTTDYDQQIKEEILSEIKNIKNDSERNEINDSWNNYSFDSGPRIYEINETYDVMFSNESAGMFQNNSEQNYSVLMGFTKYIKSRRKHENKIYM